MIILHRINTEVSEQHEHAIEKGIELKKWSSKYAFAKEAIIEKLKREGLIE